MAADRRDQPGARQLVLRDRELGARDRDIGFGRGDFARVGLNLDLSRGEAILGLAQLVGGFVERGLCGELFASQRIGSIEFQLGVAQLSLSRVDAVGVRGLWPVP